MQIMEENSSLFESLLERAEEYSKTSIELFKLKAVDKVSDVVSSIASRAIACIFFLLFFLMGSVGLALWVGDILGKSWYGFFAVAAFYGLIWVVLYFVMHKWLKKTFGDNIIVQLLK
jgi:hypothetical protein